MKAHVQPTRSGTGRPNVAPARNAATVVAPAFHPPSRTPARPGHAAAALRSIVQRTGQSPARAEEDAQASGDRFFRGAPAGGTVQRASERGAAAQSAAQDAQEIDPTISQAIESRRGGGAPLPEGLQRSMGAAFDGADFSAVRVHTGPQASALSESLQAQAFTTGKDVFFRDGAWAPETRTGQATIAHELTHTIQQGAVGRQGAGATGTVQNKRVQRLAVDDQPWPNLAPSPTLSMRKSSGGTGGVYFATDAAESVVVKLDAPEKAFSAQVANKVTAIGTGLQTTDYRILAPGSPGNAAIKADILAHTQTDQQAALGNRPVQARLAQDGPNDAADAKTAVVLMEQMPNVSLDEMARDPAQHDNLLTALTNPAVLQGFAKLIVADAITGNGDRFMKDLAPEAAVPDIPANITNIFLSPDFQNVLAMDNETFKAGEFDRAGKDPEKVWSQKMATVRALLNPTVCADIAEVLICSILYTTGDILPPADGTVPKDYHLTYIPLGGKLGPLHHKIIQRRVRAQMAAVLSRELPTQVAAITRTLRAEKKTLRRAYAAAADDASGGTGTFGKKPAAKSADLKVVTSRVKFLNVARKEKDGAKAATKGIGEALKHFKRHKKKEG